MPTLIRQIRCILWSLSLGMSVLIWSGCANGRPKLANPGTAPQQQRRAAVHDPYTDNDAGPEVAGVRPRDFQKPDAEPVRSQGFRDLRWPF